jgi:amino-acid N-acetyltransferase
MNPSPQPQIRRGKPDDMPTVLALLAAAGLPTADLAGIPRLQMWVIERKDAVLGVIAMERFGTQGLLRSLAVAPEYRKCGFGHELVARLEHDAQAMVSSSSLY